MERGPGAASAGVSAAALICWVRVERDGLTSDAVGVIKSMSKSSGRRTIVDGRHENLVVVVLWRKSDLFD